MLAVGFCLKCISFSWYNQNKRNVVGNNYLKILNKIPYLWLHLKNCLSYNKNQLPYMVTVGWNWAATACLGRTSKTSLPHSLHYPLLLLLNTFSHLPGHISIHICHTLYQRRKMEKMRNWRYCPGLDQVLGGAENVVRHITIGDKV